MRLNIPKTAAEKWIAFTRHNRNDRNLNASTYVPGVVIAPR